MQYLHSPHFPECANANGSIRVYAAPMFLVIAPLLSFLF